MANGSESEWVAINDLRERVARVESTLASLDRSIEASEKRLEGRMDDLEESITARLDRTRNTALALLAIAVPVVFSLLGALVQSGAG